ncbi:RILP-like protein 1 isoform X2 [Betta splendens]|uniref:RILP-like protein 1 n=1 Tax=Betta splendens TaxID=158456 RepID=A0A6P7NKV2_BETSP|nr:RILP-like protein 1 isoform X2 [Betta splendens]
MESAGKAALQRPAAELTVVDVYDIAAVLGRDFERVIDRFGCEALVGVVPKVVRLLELLEALVSRGAAGQEAEEMRRELDRLRQERSDRSEQERRHQQELELVEDAWRAEVQDLLSQISQLQAENSRLAASLSLIHSVTEDEQQRREGMAEKERQVMKNLKDLVDKQKDEIRAKEHELALKQEDIEALQMQQHRLMRLNQDLRHRTGVMEAQGKVLIQQRAELEAAAQAQQQEQLALQLEVTRLRKELREWELEKEVAEIEEFSLTRPGTFLPSSPQEHQSSAAALSNSTKPKSVWVECGEDPGFLVNCDKSPSLYPTPLNKKGAEEKDTTALLQVSNNKEPEEEVDSLEQESDQPRFTLQELRDVLQERNELKAEVFMLQEELAYYKSEEFEDDVSATVCPPSSPPCSNSSEQPESGIRRLIFTAIMPMVAAGLIADDPTLLPIRRLVSLV